MTTLTLGEKKVGLEYPTYFVADIAANYDGDLERAELLIRLCAEAGANAAKFQNFRASKIVSERGFQAMGKQLSHQTQWKKSVFQVYEEAALPWEWTPALKAEFVTSPRQLAFGFCTQSCRDKLQLLRD